MMIVKECKCPLHCKHYTIKSTGLGGDTLLTFNCTRCYKMGIIQVIPFMTKEKLESNAFSGWL